jgi:hypothetical protein
MNGQSQPSVDYRGQVPVDLRLSRELIFGRFWGFGYILWYMRGFRLDVTLGRLGLTIGGCQTVALKVAGSSPVTHPKHKLKAERKLGVPVNGWQSGPNPKSVENLRAGKRGKPLCPISRLAFGPVARRPTPPANDTCQIVTSVNPARQSTQHPANAARHPNLADFIAVLASRLLGKVRPVEMLER